MVSDGECFTTRGVAMRRENNDAFWIGFALCSCESRTGGGRKAYMRSVLAKILKEDLRDMLVIVSFFKPCASRVRTNTLKQIRDVADKRNLWLAHMTVEEKEGWQKKVEERAIVMMDKLSEKLVRAGRLEDAKVKRLIQRYSKADVSDAVERKIGGRTYRVQLPEEEQ